MNLSSATVPVRTLLVFLFAGSFLVLAVMPLEAMLRDPASLGRWAFLRQLAYLPLIPQIVHGTVFASLALLSVWALSPLASVRSSILVACGGALFWKPACVMTLLADTMSWSDNRVTLKSLLRLRKIETATNRKAQVQCPQLPALASSAASDWLIGYLEELSEEVVNLELSFVELGGDSLMAVDLLDGLFESFRVDLSIEDFMQAERLNDIVAYLQATGD